MLSLNQFYQQVDSLSSKQDITDILMLLDEFEDLDIRDWESLLDEENGAPKTTILYHTDQIKLLLIYWKAQQQSKPHSHPGGGGLMRVLKGRLAETRFSPESPEEVIDQRELPDGALGYVHDALAFHQVANPTEEPAVSLHIYSLKSAS